ncbi:sensor histidine kinase [Nocardia vinacea]|uniref:sensor histidine kinase n=1 Tax=Nocardia vinacea TaxID=96468 RepID=UPI001FDFCDC4|nr:nitrate- and nitrite sensing domain-containing protein [Nocardia vinacea]
MFRARLGVRMRILAIALVPSLTLLVVGVSAAGYLVADENRAENWAAQNQQAIPMAREVLESVQSERQLTLAVLAGDESAVPGLGSARTRVDKALKGLVTGTAELVEMDTSSNPENFLRLTEHMKQVRTASDAGQLPAPDAYAFYNQLLDLITSGTAHTERTAPDTEIGIGIADGLRLFLVVEAMSRSVALANMLAVANGPTSIPFEEFAHQVGYYRTETANLTAALGPTVQERLRSLQASTAWQQVAAMESALSQRNTASASGNGKSAPAPLPLSTQEWHNAAAEVSRGLTDIWLAQSKDVQQLAEDRAAAATARTLWAGGGVTAVSLVAFLIALVLANRVIRRLKRLRRETLTIADERLPDMMRRLGAGEIIDPADELPDLDYGHDEIGQVAKAFEHAHAAAVAGAVNEARTREGVKAVFLNIAHRSQVVVHRQLEILDQAEDRQEDPVLLDTLFKLDHLATRQRRNAENLIILGGGRPGRQWRNPVPLIDIMRSAIGETLDYARVRVARLPETYVVGAVVADLIHLLAELVDNATSFSPPQSRVEVSGNVVGKGVVAEISDQGMGMPPDEVDRVNEMLSNPPDFGVAALSANSRLGLFVVAQLAARHGISVRLSESDYGGIRAIALIPSALLATDTPSLTTASEHIESARRRRPVTFIDSVSNGESESAVLTTLPRLAPDPRPRTIEQPPTSESQ